MDFLRSCYETKVRPFSDSNAQTTIRWFYAHPDAGVFPYDHAFGSLNWGADQGATPGEVPGAARPWRDSFNFGFFSGGEFCGNADWFLNGCPIATPVPPPLLCCGDFGQGGLQLRGVASLYTGPSLPSSGGITLTGDCQLLTGPSYYGEGGSGMTGEAGFTVGPAFRGEGGFVATGESEIVTGAGLVFVGEGGISLTGEAPWNPDFAAELYQMPTRWHDEGFVATGNPLTYFVDTLQPYASYSYQNAPANGDNRYWEFWLPETRTWNLNILTLKGALVGKIEVYLDGSLLAAAFDLYNSTNVYGYIYAAYSGSISQGHHNINVKVNGKNALSTNYYFFCTKLWFQ